MIKTVIADDHMLVREGFKRIILMEVDMQVTGECATAQNVLECLATTECDVLVLDIEMPGRSGLDLLPDVKALHPQVQVLIQSVMPQEYFAVRALKAGAAGYISKESAADELVAAIRKVHSGRRFVSPGLLDQLVSNAASDQHSYDHLSEREFEVLRLLAVGKSPADIADDLSLSVNTINTYRKRILEKLGLNSTTELIHYALRNRLIA